MWRWRSGSAECQCADHAGTGISRCFSTDSGRERSYVCTSRAGAGQHLLTFEQQWTDKSDGRTLPSFVTDELHDFLDCGILARGLAQLLCRNCHARYVVAYSCKGRAFW